MKFLTNIKVVTAAIMGLVAVIGVGIAINNHYAKACDVEEVYAELMLTAQRLDEKIVYDDIRRMQQYIRELEMYYKKMGQPVPPDVELQIKRMQDEINRLNRSLKKG